MFANRLHFVNLTGVHIEISNPNYADAEVPRSNFDDFFWAMMTVFQILTGENWNSIMYDCWKSRSTAPAYFISLVVFGKFCVLNLFMALLLRPFDGSVVLSNRIYPEGEPAKKEEPRSCNQFIQHQLSSLFQSCCTPEYEYIRNGYDLICRRCAICSANTKFEFGLTCLIIASSVTLSLDDPLGNPTSTMAQVLLIANILFTLVFSAEFLVKVIAQGPQRYFKDSWNVLDFATVVASILELSDVKGGKTLRVMRAFRLLRPLKMVKRFPSTKIVVDALFLCLPSVANVGE